MKKKNIKLALLALCATMSMGLFVGCGNAGSGDSETTVTISGSTSVEPVMEKIKAAFEEKNPSIVLEVQGIGSGAGIKNAMQGVSEIGMSSRELKSEEAAALKETTIAYDGIAVIVNPKNKLNNLKVEDLKKIYTGEVTNWKEIGGDDKPIVVVSREEGSDTRDAFQELVGYKSDTLIKNALIASGSGNITTTVAGNEDAIGFVSFDSLKNTIKALTVNDVAATAENVLNKTYKLSRGFLLVNQEGKLSDSGKALMEFILSDEGQAIVEKAGAIKLK